MTKCSAVYGTIAMVALAFGASLAGAEIVPTSPEALEPYIPRNEDGSIDSERMQSEPHPYLKMAADQVASETLEETVANLTLSWEIQYIPSLWDHPEAYFAKLDTLPRVERLLDVIQHGSEAEQARLQEALIQFCHDYIHEYPIVAQSDAPGSRRVPVDEPSVYYVGTAVVAPYVLAQLDPDPEHLRLFDQMNLRWQDARRADQMHEGDAEEETRWVNSDFVTMLAAATDHILMAQSQPEADWAELVADYRAFRQSHVDDQADIHYVRRRALDILAFLTENMPLS